MRHSFRMKLLAGVFVPAVALAAGTAYGMGTDKMKGDASANTTATAPATPSSATPSTTTNNGMSRTSGADATFARLDTNHDGKLTSTEVAGDTKVHGMWKKLDANGDGTVSKSEFEAHASDLK